MSDLISRQAAIDALKVAYWDKDIQSAKDDPCIVDAMTDWAIRQIKALPSAQSEQSIPILWIEKQIDWLKSMDNEFSNITAMNISTLVKKWRKENGKDE